jgi:hypothetical protein
MTNPLGTQTDGGREALHRDIMNLPYSSSALDGLANPLERACYKFGHCDARHAAAELVLEASPPVPAGQQGDSDAGMGHLAAPGSDRALRAFTDSTPGWIDVNERLPGDCDVLVFSLKDGQRIACYEREQGLWFTPTAYAVRAVTHWMPLPAPPTDATTVNRPEGVPASSGRNGKEAPEVQAWMWQHEETGNVGFIDVWQVENGWQAANPRCKLVRPLVFAPAHLQGAASTQENING